MALLTRPDGTLKVRVGGRRVLGCRAAGVFVLGFVLGAEGTARPSGALT